VNKPDPKIFRLALRRLGLSPDLASAMFITENPDHIAQARALGMAAWQYGADFHDWNQPPALVAQALGDG
jgi:FMN phosphatase YigB (HAD superfamily)